MAKFMNMQRNPNFDSKSTVTMPQDIKVDLNAIGSDNFAPIHAACSVGNIEAVNYLVFKKKCDPNLKSLTDDWTPLEISCWSAHPRITDLLLKD
jgi:ankyrin repeat protein